MSSSRRTIPFIAVRGSVTSQLMKNYPALYWSVLCDYRTYGTPGILPTGIENIDDPRQGVDMLLDQFVGGREHLMWQLFDVLERTGIYPNHPQAQKWTDVSEWHHRPANTPLFIEIHNSIAAVSAPWPRTFAQIRSELRLALVHAFPWRLEQLRNEWNAVYCNFGPDHRRFQPSFNSYGDPDRAVAEVLNYFEHNQHGLRLSQLYHVMCRLHLQLSTPWPLVEGYLSEEDLYASLRKSTMPSGAIQQQQPPQPQQPPPIASASLPSRPPLPLPAPSQKEKYGVALDELADTAEKPQLQCTLCLDRDLRLVTQCGHASCV